MEVIRLFIALQLVCFLSVTVLGDATQWDDKYRTRMHERGARRSGPGAAFKSSSAYYNIQHQKREDFFRKFNSKAPGNFTADLDVLLQMRRKPSGSCRLNVPIPDKLPPKRPSSANSSNFPPGSRDATIGGRHLLTDPPSAAAAPPPPDPMTDWPESGFTVVWTPLELVQALLEYNPLIIIASDLNLIDVVPLPNILYEVQIIGVCQDYLCRLDAMLKSNIFIVGPGGYLTLKDLDLRNGVCSAGGAVLVNGMGVTMELGEAGLLFAWNVHFFNNSAEFEGGAIAVVGGGLAHYHACVFVMNRAPWGGAVYIGAPGDSMDLSMAPSPSKTTLDTGPPSDATITEGCGMSSCGTVVDSLFYMNDAMWGGAIYVDDSYPGCTTWATSGMIDVSNTRFMNNSAVLGGGLYLGWYTWGSLGQVSDSDFIDNEAMNDYGKDIMMDNVTQGWGRVQLYAYDTSFEMNRAVSNGVTVGYRDKAYFWGCMFGSPETLLCVQGSRCKMCGEWAVPPANSQLVDEAEASAPVPSRSVGWSVDDHGHNCRLRMTSLCGWEPPACIYIPDSSASHRP